VEDLALTVIAQGIGKKDHRDFDGTHEELIQLYLSTPRPLLRLTKTDLAYLVVVSRGGELWEIYDRVK
jgi:hypothetical protein